MADWATPFPVGNVYRFDLQRVGLTNEQINRLSDLDMLEIAQTMQALYLQGSFWKHLLEAAEKVLLNKEEKAKEAGA